MFSNLKSTLSYIEYAFFQVSKTKGSTNGNFHFDCGATCPQLCIGDWKVAIGGQWKIDTTLDLTKQQGE